MAIGWNELADLNTYNSREDILKKLQDLKDSNRNYYNDKDLECYLDNGNHLIIKAYQNTSKYQII